MHDNLTKAKKLMLSLDPHQYVRCDMDDFAPYAYFDRPIELDALLVLFTPEDMDDFCEFETRYLNELQHGNGRSIEGIKQELLDSIPKEDNMNEQPKVYVSQCSGIFMAVDEQGRFIPISTPITPSTSVEDVALDLKSRGYSVFIQSWVEFQP